MGGPVNAPTPLGGGTPPQADEVVKKLNTAIYDYLLRNSLYNLARSFKNELPILIKDDIKHSPGQRNGQANGSEGSMDVDDKDPGICQRPDDLPLPANPFDGPFLHDWWCQFWELYFGRRNKPGSPQTSMYLAQQRFIQKNRQGLIQLDPNLLQPARGYNGMVGPMPNGMGGMPTDLKRTAMQNNRANMYVQRQLAARHAC